MSTLDDYLNEQPASGSGDSLDAYLNDTGDWKLGTSLTAKVPRNPWSSTISMLTDNPPAPHDPLASVNAMLETSRTPMIQRLLPPSQSMPQNTPQSTAVDPNLDIQDPNYGQNRMAAAVGGAAKDITLGMWSPYQNMQARYPEAAGFGGLVGSVVPYIATEKALSLIPKIGKALQVAKEGAPLLRARQAVVRGVTLGATVGAEQQGAAALRGEGFNGSDVALNAGAFGVMEGAGSVIGSVMRLIRQGRYDRAYEAYRAATEGSETKPLSPEVEDWLKRRATAQQLQIGYQPGQAGGAVPGNTDFTLPGQPEPKQPIVLSGNKIMPTQAEMQNLTPAEPMPTPVSTEPPMPKPRKPAGAVLAEKLQNPEPIPEPSAPTVDLATPRQGVPETRKVFVHETNHEFQNFDINKAGSNTGEQWFGKGQYLQEKGTFKFEKYGNKSIEYTLPADAKIMDANNLYSYAESKGILPDRLKNKVATFKSDSELPNGMTLDKSDNGKYYVWDSNKDGVVDNVPSDSPELALKRAYNKINNIEEPIGNITPKDIFDAVGREKLVSSLQRDGYHGFNNGGELVMYSPDRLNRVLSPEFPASPVATPPQPPIPEAAKPPEIAVQGAGEAVKQPWETTDEYVYHRTSPNNFESIRKSGLLKSRSGEYPHGRQDIPDATKRIYFGESPTKTNDFGGGLVIRVRKDAISDNVKVVKMGLRGEETWYFGDKVNPSDIEVRNQNGTWGRLARGKRRVISPPPSNPAAMREVPMPSGSPSTPNPSVSGELPLPIRPEATKREIIGAPLSHAEIADAAQSSTGLNDFMGREDTKSLLANLKATDDKVNELAKDPANFGELIQEAGKVSKASAFFARGLGSFKKIDNNSLFPAFVGPIGGFKRDENGNVIYDPKQALMMTGLGIAGAAGMIFKDEIGAGVKKLLTPPEDIANRINARRVHQEVFIRRYFAESIAKAQDAGTMPREAVLMAVDAAKVLDWKNQNQIGRFARTYLKPYMKDLEVGKPLTEFRMANMLSSPLTHAVNTFSNALQIGGVRPATLLVSGLTDPIASTLRGGAKQAWLGQVPAYAKGVYSNFAEASYSALDALKNGSTIYRPDIPQILSGSKAVSWSYPVLNALEAADVFAQTLAKGGERESLAYAAHKAGKDIPIRELNQQASENAQKLIFRGDLQASLKSSEGYVLGAADMLTRGVYGIRKVPGMSWVIPFIKTPAQIAKQGLEYSPLGFTTMAGAANPQEQFSKALIGSVITGTSAMLAFNGRTTWAVPKDKKQKEQFYAAGMKPYSFKIGDKWIQYTRLGTLAYPMAMGAALKYYSQDSPNALTDSKLAKLESVVGGIAKFFSDQSYVQGMQDVLESVQEGKIMSPKQATGYVSQLVPLVSLQRWIDRMVDPIYRNPKDDWTPESLVQQLAVGIPGASQIVEPYRDNNGQPSKRPYPIINALSPVGINPDNPQGESIFWQMVRQRQQQQYQKNLRPPRPPRPPRPSR